MLYETSSFVKFAGVFKSIVAGPLFATVSKAGQPIFNFAEHPLTEVSSYFFVSASIAACEIASSKASGIWCRLELASEQVQGQRKGKRQVRNENLRQPG